MTSVPSNLRLAEARDIVASGTSGKSLPVIEFMDAQQAEIERLRALLREVGSEVSAIGCEGADDAICIETTRAKEDWCPYCRIGTIVQNAASPAETIGEQK